MTMSENLGVHDRPTYDPYHSDLRELILKEMATHGRDVPLSYHEQQRLEQQAAAQRHTRAVEHDAAVHDIPTLQMQAARARDARETLARQLERAMSEEAIARDAIALIRSRVNNAAG